MKRLAFLGKVKKGCEEEYIKRHDDIWPEVVKVYKAAGILSMTVFMSGVNLFGYIEIDEEIFEREKENLSRDPVEIKWQEFLGEIADRTETQAAPAEVFHME